MRNKLKYLLFFLIIWSKTTYGQSDSLLYYIKQLDWNSFAESANFAPRLILYDKINNLIVLQDSSKVKLLIKSLQNSAKTVAAHIALTKIFNPQYDKFGSSTDVGGSSTINYIYNGLNKNGDGKIERNNIKAIIKFWKKKSKVES